MVGINTGSDRTGTEGTRAWAAERKMSYHEVTFADESVEEMLADLVRISRALPSKKVPGFANLYKEFEEVLKARRNPKLAAAQKKKAVKSQWRMTDQGWVAPDTAMTTASSSRGCVVM